ncbi:hypothetical protein LTR85_006436 [Meristemomyces frigidus]|nr:hypothetical protein LTR85_006436 [Meristemomyces frigidus]
MEVEGLKKAFSSAFEKYDTDPAKQHFTRAWRQDLEIIEAKKLGNSSARIVYRFPVKNEYLNPSGGFHAATFLDVGTSFLIHLVSRPGFWPSGGTSRTLNVTYLRPAKEGDVLRMECDIVHMGKRLCLLKGAILREKDGAVVSVCEHNKVNLSQEKV